MDGYIYRAGLRRSWERRFTRTSAFTLKPASRVIYGAGPRTLLESNAKRADERLALDELRRATQVIARTLHELLAPAP